MKFTNQTSEYNSFGDQMYMDLMEQFDKLSRDVFRDEGRAANVKQAQAEAKDELDSIEASVVLQLGGWKKLGSNDTERKYALQRALANDERYSKAKQSLAKLQADFDNIQEQSDNTRRMLHAVGNAMRLHAAMVLSTSAVSIALPTASTMEMEGLDL